ncbi:GTP cyclohydrolase II [Patescibacteria group bacterium]|nr:GTP cyclohydrolase II [Patescibacteria group bacterium]
MDNLKPNTTKKLISRESSTHIPTKYGIFHAFAYVDKTTGSEHLALVNGEIKSDEPINVRVHSECLTGDTLGSLKCDCGQQLDFALNYIAKNGGVVLYLHDHEGRGIGLVNKIKAYELINHGLDTVEANLKLGLPVENRNYETGAQILVDLGVRKMNLLTNNPAKITGLSDYGLEIVKRVPIEIIPNKNNGKYLKTKRDKMGHILSN